MHSWQAAVQGRLQDLEGGPASSSGFRSSSSSSSSGTRGAAAGAAAAGPAAAVQRQQPRPSPRQPAYVGGRGGGAVARQAGAAGAAAARPAGGSKEDQDFDQRVRLLNQGERQRQLLYAASSTTQVACPAAHAAAHTIGSKQRDAGCVPGSAYHCPCYWAAVHSSLPPIHSALLRPVCQAQVLSEVLDTAPAVAWEDVAGLAGAKQASAAAAGQAQWLHSN